MDKQIAKLRAELNNGLRQAYTAYEENTDKTKANDIAIKALFNAVKLLTDTMCGLLDMSSSNDEQLQVIATGMQDFSKLAQATQTRLSVLRPGH